MHLHLDYWADMRKAHSVQPYVISLSSIHYMVSDVINMINNGSVEAPGSSRLGGKPQKSEQIKCATILHIAGDDANKVFNTFTFDGDVDDFEVL